MSLDRSNSARAIAGVALGAAALFTMTACGGGSEAKATEPTDSAASPAVTTPSPTQTATAEPATAEPTTPAADANGVTAAAWAKPVTSPGEVIGTIKGDGFEAKVYQVAVVKATKNGNFVDPDTNKPLIAAGDDIVYLNYVVTNTGDKAIPVSASLVNIDPKYKDWKWAQGMDATTDLAQYEELKVNESALAPGAVDFDKAISWEPGTSYSVGTNFKYQKNSPIVFEAGLTPALPDGKLDHANKQEVTITAVIK